MIARLVAVIAVIAVVALSVAPAQADPDARAQAAAHARQGQAFFQRSDFDRALAEYQAAFDLSAEPSLIFNIALCHDRANRPEAALQAFQRYLALAPAGSVAEEARTDVARLTPIVETIVADRTAQEARQRDEAARREQATRRDEAARRRDESAARRVRLSRYMMLAGAVIAAGGGVVNLVERRTVVRLNSESDRDPTRYADDLHTYRIERDVTYGAYAVGATTFAAGLVLALLSRGGGDGPQLSAALTPGGAAMTVAWSR